MKICFKLQSWIFTTIWDENLPDVNSRFRSIFLLLLPGWSSSLDLWLRAYANPLNGGIGVNKSKAPWWWSLPPPSSSTLSMVGKFFFFLMMILRWSLDNMSDSFCSRWSNNNSSTTTSAAASETISPWKKKSVFFWLGWSKAAVDDDLRA